ncbi:MAG: nicotinate phosphoribosyltransferase [Planctomycetes bacterium]|nr:nicotinate phosphoribosyltransferase [Planctomycetota bacterium]
MAYGYWKAGVAEHEAVFHLTFRRAPFGGGFAIACGLGPAVEYLQRWRFTADDAGFLASLTGGDGRPLFEPAFLDYLQDLRFRCDLDAIPEGTAVFPHEPLLRVRGPVLQAQLLETPLLNLINFQTLIATKAARICIAARGEPVLEFGLRRAQGVDGGLAASRAAYAGGCAATSNLLAAKLYGIPAKGTHAHSWVTFFDTEPESFQKYAEAMPNNSLFLVDTYDSLEGVGSAVRVGRWLREQGHEFVGIRLDSGDLSELSIRSRQILDEAGFPQAAIVASGDLDEYLIDELKTRGAKINVWGAGTRLVTAYDEPALGGVYKLSAVRAPGGQWQQRLKLSEQTVKTSDPGILQVRRFRDQGQFISDVIYNELHGCAGPTMVDIADPTLRTPIPALDGEALLEPVFRGGELVAPPPPLNIVRQRVKDQLALLPSGVKRFTQPDRYPVGLEQSLYELKRRLIQMHQTPSTSRGLIG